MGNRKIERVISIYTMLISDFTQQRPCLTCLSHSPTFTSPTSSRSSFSILTLHIPRLQHSRITYDLTPSKLLFASPNCCPTSFPSGCFVRGIITHLGFPGRVQISNVLFQCPHKHTSAPRSHVLIFGEQALRHLHSLDELQERLRRHAPLQDSAYIRKGTDGQDLRHRNCPSGLVVPISIMILALPPLLSIINRSRNLIRVAALAGFSGNHAQDRSRSPILK